MSPARTLAWLVAVGVAVATMIAVRTQTRPLPPTASVTTSAPRAEGRALYVHCQACHGLDGQGIAGFAPTLRTSTILTGDPSALARLVVHGTLSTARWPQPMPGLGPRLNDDDMATLLTWLRQQWGHHADPIMPAVITAARPFTP